MSGRLSDEDGAAARFEVPEIERLLTAGSPALAFAAIQALRAQADRYERDLIRSLRWDAKGNVLRTGRPDQPSWSPSQVRRLAGALDVPRGRQGGRRASVRAEVWAALLAELAAELREVEPLVRLLKARCATRRRTPGCNRF